MLGQLGQLTEALSHQSFGLTIFHQLSDLSGQVRWRRERACISAALYEIGFMRRFHNPSRHEKIRHDIVWLVTRNHRFRQAALTWILCSQQIPEANFLGRDIIKSIARMVYDARMEPEEDKEAKKDCSGWGS